MSTLNVDKVDPSTGTALEIGTSGDTINVPSGVTLDVNAGATLDATGATITGIASIDWQAVQTSSPITGAAGKGYPVNTTSGAITINLPAGSVGNQVALVDYAGTFDSNALTISANGSEKIKGSTDDATMDTERQAGVLTYVDATQGWVLTSAAPDPGIVQAVFITATGGTITTDGDYKVHTFTGNGTFEVTQLGNAAGSNTVDWLAVAGGGGGAGGRGGAGGAGGMRYNYPNPSTGGTPVSATTYPIVIGGGGAAGAGSSGPSGGTNNGVNGSNTTALGFTSYGGGFGASGSPFPATVGGPGGSGGGGGYEGGPGDRGNAGTGNTPPVSSPGPQGNAGGGGNGDAPGYGGGGGGGHGAVGGIAWPSPQDGDGGAGTAITIPGASTTYAGGGGGGKSSGPDYGGTPQPVGTGGAGGGGNSGENGGPANPAGGPAGVAGTANKGGGGGGGSYWGAAPQYYQGSGGAGGSGVVVVRYKFQ